MTLAAETMSSILQSPQSSSAVSSKSKLGFSIDSIVGAKNNVVFRSDSQSPPSPRDLEHASQKLRESLTSIVSPTDLSLRSSFFDQRDSRGPPFHHHHHPFGLISSSPRSPPAGSPSSNNASLSFHRMAAAAMAAAQAAAAGNASAGVSPPPTRGRSRSRSRSPAEYERESRKRRCSSTSPSLQRRLSSSSSPNPPSSSSQLGASPQPSSQPPSLVRPIPTNGSLPGSSNGGLPLAQSYLDHLANLKAFYDQSAAAAISAAVSSASGNSPTTCSISQGPPPSGPHPGLGHLGHLGGPLGHLGLHRPPGMGHPGLPPMFLGSGGPAGTPLPPQIPREYPLYPWFISRRFPGGESLNNHAILLNTSCTTN